MAEFVNLAGVVTKDLVESIGTGKYSAAYVNWSRTLQLLRQHAPGWSVETKEASDGGILFKAPVGGYLQLRVVHTDGTVGPWVPQAVMDNRNKDIAFERIGARDITDTQRRGSCMCLAFTFGLAAELWAKMKLESGWGASLEESEAPKAPAAPKAGTQTTATPAPAVVEGRKAFYDAPAPAVVEGVKASEATFREEALGKGIHTVAIDALVSIVAEKLGGDFAKGLEVLASKSAEELNKKYAPSDSGGEQW